MMNKKMVSTVLTTEPQSGAADNRIWYFDILRILATFFVIVLHVTSANWSSLAYTTNAWKIHHFFNGASRWAVPVFVMLSGALFLDPTKPLSTSKLYHRNILRMVKTFIIWSVFYALVYVLRTEDVTISTLLYLLVCGYNHLWFLYLIISLYMLVPVLRKITEDKQLLQYSVLIGLIFVFLFPALIRFLSQFDTKLVLRVLPIISNMHGQTALSKASEYILYYLLGYYLFSKEITGKYRHWIYIAGLCGFALTFILTLWSSDRNGAQTGQYYAPETLNVLFMSIAVFIFGKAVLSRVPLSSKVQKAIAFLSKHSFVIYLIHIFILNLLQDLGLHSLILHPVISIPLLAVLIFLLSLFVAVGIEWVKNLCTEFWNSRLKTKA